MILLDTNALLWLAHRDRRSRPLERHVGQLYMSPASLLEIQVLIETGRIRLRSTATTVREFADDERWMLDDPSSADWFERALDVRWTRDPFDRLLVAHAGLRGWRLAITDADLLARVPSGPLELIQPRHGADARRLTAAAWPVAP
jgi:PIN domain nuclease of toxin-antitoxin system